VTDEDEDEDEDEANEKGDDAKGASTHHALTLEMATQHVGAPSSNNFNLNDEGEATDVETAGSDGDEREDRGCRGEGEAESVGKGQRQTLGQGGLHSDDGNNGNYNDDDIEDGRIAQKPTSSLKLAYTMSKSRGGDGDADIDDDNDDAALGPDPEDNLPPLSLSTLKSLFQDWNLILNMGIPGALSLFVEWGSFELAASLAGSLGTIPLAVHAIYMQTCGFFYTVPLSLASATATLASTSLGKRDFTDAKQIIHLGIALDCMVGVCSGCFLLLVRSYWGLLFTNEREVDEGVRDYMWVMTIYCIVDASKCVTLNVLRSTGQARITLMGNVLCCIVILLPLGSYLKGPPANLGLVGIWLAMCAAWGTATVIYFVKVLMTDWENLCLVDSLKEEAVAASH